MHRHGFSFYLKEKIVIRMFMLFLILFTSAAFSEEENIVNVYSWATDLPNEVVQAFEKETGIKVNRSGYGSNEEMYAKLRAVGTSSYDVIEPTSYYVARMASEGMLESLDVTKLSNYKNLTPSFLKPPYDPSGTHGIPYFWGLTGIFVNRKYFPDAKITGWADLWKPEYKGKLLILDDPRELFSAALILLGYSPNDSDLKQVQAAYERLTQLLPNIKLFNSSAVVSIVGDEDATIGMIWNYNFREAAAYNKNLEFIFPKEGFVMWVDNFAIPKGAKHLENAYRFLNFILRPDIAKIMSVNNQEAITNKPGRALLPASMRDDPVIYPPEDVLKRGIYQTDISDAALAAYAADWELLKLQ